MLTLPLAFSSSSQILTDLILKVVLLKVWSVRQYHSVTCWKCRFSGSTPAPQLRILWGGPNLLCFNTFSSWSVGTVKSGEHCFLVTSGSTMPCSQSHHTRCWLPSSSHFWRLPPWNLEPQRSLTRGEQSGVGERVQDSKSRLY